MRRSSLLYTLAAVVGLLVLAAAIVLVMRYERVPSAPRSGGETPEASVRESLALIKAGDFGGFWIQALPPVDYTTLRVDWTRPHPETHPLSDEDRANFMQSLQSLTEPGAEDKLYAVAKPKLAQLQSQYSDQLPVMIGIGQAILSTGVAQSKELTNLQKEQVQAAINVLAPWAQQQSWFDQAKAKQAITLAVATARKLDLKSPEAMRAMDFDTAMTKYGTGFLGLKQLLALYGLSLDAVIDSARISAVDNHNGHARVHIDYTLLGKPLSVESNLVEQDGRWYSEDMLQNVRTAHAQLVAPAGSGSVAATSTAPAPASTAPALPTPSATPAIPAAH